jgi:hypothetical protein
MAKRTLRIDIQHEGMARVIVRAGIRYVDMEKSGWISFPNESGRDLDLPAALSTLKEDINPSGLTCIAALPDRDIVCRTSQDPFRDRKKIRQTLAKLSEHSERPGALETVYQTVVAAGEEQLQLSGSTDTLEAVNQTKSFLEKPTLYQKLTIVTASMDPTTERVRFKFFYCVATSINMISIPCLSISQKNQGNGLLEAVSQVETLEG